MVTRYRIRGRGLFGTGGSCLVWWCSLADVIRSTCAIAIGHWGKSRRPVPPLSSSHLGRALFVGRFVVPLSRTQLEMAVLCCPLVQRGKCAVASFPTLRVESRGSPADAGARALRSRPTFDGWKAGSSNKSAAPGSCVPCGCETFVLTLLRGNCTAMHRPGRWPIVKPPIIRFARSHKELRGWMRERVCVQGVWLRCSTGESQGPLRTRWCGGQLITKPTLEQDLGLSRGQSQK